MIRRAAYTALDAVREFHQANGSLIHDQPPEDHPIPIEVALLRYRLILEELGETAVAFHDKNLIEMADGLTDLYYVLIGTAVSYGLSVADTWPGEMGEDEPLPAIPHELQDTVLSRMLVELAGHCTKALAAIFNCSAICQCGRADCYAARVSESQWDLANTAVGEACVCVCAISYELGLPFKALFFEVHRANLSKKLGGAGTGGKYAAGGGKADGYRPPDVAGILSRSGRPVEGDGAPAGQP